MARRAAVLRAAAPYFLVVFTAGFVLGVVRETLLVERLGQRGAELAEMPVMLAVVVLAARRLARRHGAALGAGGLLAAGTAALAALLAVELAVVLRLRGLTLAGYVESRDPVAGAAYAVSLLVFALAPWLAAAWRRRGR